MTNCDIYSAAKASANKRDSADYDEGRTNKYTAGGKRQVLVMRGEMGRKRNGWNKNRTSTETVSLGIDISTSKRFLFRVIESEVCRLGV